MSTRFSLAVVLGASVLVSACKGGGEDSLVTGLARSTMKSAQAEVDKGNFKEARSTCKIVDNDALRKLESDDGKKAKAEYDALCSVDVPAGEAKAEIEGAFKEFQTAIVSAPTNAEFKKGRVEAACDSGKSSAGYFDTYKGNDRPLAKALAAEMAAHCTPAALTIPAPAATATAAAAPAAKAAVPKAAAKPAAKK